MTEVSFYHLTKSDLRRALPSLLEKVLESGKRSVLLVSNEEKLQEIDSMLWTFSTNRFIPHGTFAEDYKADQPVYLTTTEENPNKAEILVIVDGAKPEYVKKFDRVLDIFDGNDEEAANSARERWRSYKKDMFELKYWQQSEKGAWEAKAA